MSEPAGPAVDDDAAASPFPAAYGPVGPRVPGRSGVAENGHAARDHRQPEPARASLFDQAHDGPVVTVDPVIEPDLDPLEGPTRAQPLITSSPVTGAASPVLRWASRPPETGTPEANGDAAAERGARPARPPKITVVRSRSSRRLVRRIDTWTVFKVSLVFYLLLLVIVLLAGIAAWQVAVSLSFISDIQKAVRSLADDTTFVLHPMVVLEYASLIGIVLAIAGTLLNVVASLLYNLISDLIGGVQVVVVTQPDGALPGTDDEVGL